MEKAVLEKLDYFTLADLSNFYKNKQSALVHLNRAKKAWKIKKLRSGFYVWDLAVQKLVNSSQLTDFLEYVATNVIYVPSYLSREYVLFKYGVLPENVYAFTLVSTKKTKTFKTDFGVFDYKHIKKDYFGDYRVIKKWRFWIYEASLEKALWDWFYLKRGIVFEKSYFEELRLNLEPVDLKEFEKIVKKYKVKKLEKVLDFLKELKNDSWRH